MVLVKTFQGFFHNAFMSASLPWDKSWTGRPHADGLSVTLAVHCYQKEKCHLIFTRIKEFCCCFCFELWLVKPLNGMSHCTPWWRLQLSPWSPSRTAVFAETDFGCYKFKRKAIKFQTSYPHCEGPVQTNPICVLSLISGLSTLLFQAKLEEICNLSRFVAVATTLKCEQHTITRLWSWI